MKIYMAKADHGELKNILAFVGSDIDELHKSAALTEDDCKMVSVLQAKCLFVIARLLLEAAEP